jgi:uncharacterized protein
MMESGEMSPTLVVGFDLDMTLIDSRRAVRIALSALASEAGVAIDVERVVLNLGPPLEEALSPWFNGDDLEEACRRYLTGPRSSVHLL